MNADYDSAVAKLREALVALDSADPTLVAKERVLARYGPMFRPESVQRITDRRRRGCAPQARVPWVRGPSNSHTGCSPAEQEVGWASASVLVGVIGVMAVELLTLLSKLTQCHE